MKGNVDEAVKAGAHAFFLPHGLGHMMGLDVHDMEGLGENYPRLPEWSETPLANEFRIDMSGWRAGANCSCHLPK